jgi:hypothetical protein
MVFSGSSIVNGHVGKKHPYDIHIYFVQIKNHRINLDKAIG